MKTIHWNTGRGYTAHGQRMAATQLADGRVMFADIDRMITGVTTAPCELTRYDVMHAYDHCEYGWGSSSSPDYWDMRAELSKVAQEKNYSCAY